MRKNKNSLDLFMAHRGELVDYASGFVGSRSHGEDVVQEAWLRFDRVAKQRFLDEPLGYLYRIVRNIALDGRRQQVREGRTMLDGIDQVAETTQADQPSPEAEALYKQQVAIIRAALAELPERTRIAVEMHRVDGCKLKEIAGKLGISVTLAHNLVAEGVDHCRRRLRRPG